MSFFEEIHPIFTLTDVLPRNPSTDVIQNTFQLLLEKYAKNIMYSSIPYDRVFQRNFKKLAKLAKNFQFKMNLTPI